MADNDKSTDGESNSDLSNLSNSDNEDDEFEDSDDQFQYAEYVPQEDNNFVRMLLLYILQSSIIKAELYLK